MNAVLPHIEHNYRDEELRIEFTVYAHRKLSDEELANVILSFCQMHGAESGKQYEINSTIGAPGT